MKHDPKDTKKIEQLRTEFEQLDQLGETPGVAVAQHRGHRFEGLLLDLLNSHGLLLRTSFHTADNRREQIDGAIRIDSRIALIEAKWTKQDVTASELYAFLGKIEGKFVGTIGLFVSRTELSENFITSLRSGRRQSTLIIHGDDVPHIFTPEFPLEEYLTACIARVSIDNVAHLPAAQFLAEREEQKQAKQTSDDARKLLEPLYESLRRPDTATLIPLLTKEKKPDELEQEITLLLRVLPKILLQATENNPARRNIPAYIASGAQRLPSSPTPVDRQFFSTLDAAIQRDEYHPIIDAFSKRLNLLPPELTRPANQAIQDAWLKAATFEDENRLVGPTRSLWPSLDDDTKSALLRKFLRIVNDPYHRPGYPQFELCLEILNNPQNLHQRNKILAALLEEEYNGLLPADHPSTSEDQERAHLWSRAAFRRARQLLVNIDDLFGDRDDASETPD